MGRQNPISTWWSSEPVAMTRQFKLLALTGIVYVGAITLLAQNSVDGPVKSHLYVTVE